MTKDDINKIKELSKILFCQDFNNKIFSTDFKKEVEAFKKMENNLDERENINLYFDNLDIILKIIGINLYNVLNPALIKNLFLFLDSLYIILNENDYKISDIESNIIICLLIDKLSLNNNQIKDHLINLINKYIELFEVNKSGLIILNYALNKNNKIKSNVLDMIIELYLNKKINNKSKNYIKILSKYLLVNDNIVKSKCITGNICSKDDCKSNAPFRIDFNFNLEGTENQVTKCVSSCIENNCAFYENSNKKCTNSCSSINYVIYEGACLDQCPEGLYKSEHQCVSKCEHNFYKPDGSILMNVKKVAIVKVLNINTQLHLENGRKYAQ